MNEKIRDLAEQATKKYDRLGFEIPFAQPDLEVFANLIIQECYELCASNLADIKQPDFDLTYNDGVMDCALMIKQYFGDK